MTFPCLEILMLTTTGICHTADSNALLYLTTGMRSLCSMYCRTCRGTIRGYVPGSTSNSSLCEGENDGHQTYLIFTSPTVSSHAQAPFSHHRHLPIGVLFDFLSPLVGEGSSSLPWELTIHYTGLPDSLLGWTNGLTTHNLYFHVLKVQQD